MAEFYVERSDMRKKKLIIRHLHSYYYNFVMEDSLKSKLGPLKKVLSYD